MHLELGEDPERLRVALEAVGQPETLPGQAVEHPLAEMPERRMTKIMGVGGGLHHDMIKTAKITKQVTILGAQQADRDRPGHGGDLDRVGQPVVHHSAGRPGGDHLGDLGEPGERLGEPDPLQIGAELRLAAARTAAPTPVGSWPDEDPCSHSYRGRAVSDSVQEARLGCCREPRRGKRDGGQPYG